ncbi:MAG: tetratricopeptide repeat protein [Thermodesulfobacteriota bacterium]|nr:tetratricopeptide repeat protein [Thermodesulfobacteriota bacterium]
MQRTVTLAPEIGIAHLHLSKCYLHHKKPLLALEIYNKAIKFNSRLKDMGYWIDIQDGLCNPLIKARLFDKAVAIYENVLKELKSETSETFLNKYYILIVYKKMAEVYHKAGNLDKSIEIYEKALNIEEEKIMFGFITSQIVDIHRSLAKIFIEKGNYQKAGYHEKKADELEWRKRLVMNFFLVGVPLSVQV